MDASNDILKTAIICPPDIFGQGKGVGGRMSFIIPNYVDELLKQKEAFYLGEGQSMRAVTHIDDVVDLFIILLEQALQGGGNAQWGREVRFFFFYIFAQSLTLVPRASTLQSPRRLNGLMLRSPSTSWASHRAGCQPTANLSVGIRQGLAT
jgi:hypothetical protein